MTGEQALFWSSALAGVGVVLASLEAALVPRVYGDDGLMGWPVNSVAYARHPWANRRSFRTIVRWLDRLLEARWNSAWAFVRLLAVAPAVVAPGAFGAVGAFVVALVGLLSFVRSPYGQDGADQVFLMIFVTVGIAKAVPTPAVLTTAAAFLGFQGLIAYGFAGLAKAMGPSWRSGEALTGTFGTRLYGSPGVYAWLRAHPAVARWGSRMVTAWELSFPLLLFFPAAVALGYLAIGALFHLVSAFTMGLNTFLWAFPALYPCVWFVYATWPR
jgi:hypothetical protein